MRRTPATGGFTLVELLVVMATIGVLVSIIFPVLARAKEKARLTLCTSNLAQQQLAVSMYMQDYDDCFPHARTIDSGEAVRDIPTLVSVLRPYVDSKDIWFCPSWMAEHGDEMTTTRSMWRDYAATYGYNAFPGQPGTLFGKALSEIDTPSDMPMLWCASGSAHSGINADEWAAGAPGAVNVCYVDGHVKLFHGALRDWIRLVYSGDTDDGKGKTVSK